jgi:hypothetical protein
MKKLLERKELILITIILLIAAFLRLYRISDYMTFLGDEGRDSLIVRNIVFGFGDLLQGHFSLAKEHLTLLGPRASAGDFFTGPIYYYMMAPFLFLWNFNPVGPAIMIAILSVVTTYLIYKFGKEFFGSLAGLIAAGLYALAPVVITYAHSSWNPNPMPFFTLLLLYALYKGVVEKKKWLFALVGILYGITLQLHYIELFTGLIIMLFTLIGSLDKNFLSLFNSLLPSSSARNFQKIKTIRRTYKDALESTSHYRDLLEKLESLKATKKEIEAKTKSELGAEYQQMEAYKMNLQADKALLSDLALNTLMSGETVVVKDDNASFEPVFTVQFRKARVVSKEG